MLSGKLQFKLKLKTMRVVCISNQWNEESGAESAPRPKRGDICTVISEEDVHGRKFFSFIEFDSRYLYWVGNFVEINEDQQDETEMERNLLHEKIEL